MFGQLNLGNIYRINIGNFFTQMCYKVILNVRKRQSNLFNRIDGWGNIMKTWFQKDDGCYDVDIFPLYLSGGNYKWGNMSHNH